MSEEKPSQSNQLSSEDDCYSFNLDSSSSEGSVVFTRETLKRPASCIVIDSDSEDSDPEKKKAKILVISSEDEDVEVIPDPKKQPTTLDPQEAIVIDDHDEDHDQDEDDNRKMDAGSHDKGLIASIEKDMKECVISLLSSSDDDKEEDLGDPEAELKSPAKSFVGKAVSEVEQPVKKKKKSKSVSVIPGKPADDEQNFGPSQMRRPLIAKVEKYRIGTSPCNIPGCFLIDIVKSKRYTGRNFKQNRDDLVRKIYSLLNFTVFEGQLPEIMEISWNKKMLRTAGLCQFMTLERKEERYAKISISLKVCTSADRIRDTLVHEICHAATWLIDGVRDSHGQLWKYYAQKCITIHPELPKVTRCHNYDIKYKIYYECALCKYRVGRYSRSLNTDRFKCAKCKGPLVLLPLFRKDGTPIVPHVRPFAKYVQENYRAVFKSTAGITHGEVMKKLSQDYFASKEKKNLQGMHSCE